MSTHVQEFQSSLRFSHHFVLAKLTTSSLRVDGLILKQSNNETTIKQNMSGINVKSSVLVYQDKACCCINRSYREDENTYLRKKTAIAMFN